DRAPRDREPEARPARLGREERLEEVRQRVRRNAGAAVAHLERGGTVPVGDRDQERAWAGRLGGHGVERVLEQIDQHLAELLAVGARRDAVRQLRLERHAARLEAGAERLERRAGQLAQIDRLEAEVLATREAEERGHLSLDALELAQDEAVLGGEGRRGLARELLREAPGGGHGVADLVRDARGQRGHAAGSGAKAKAPWVAASPLASIRAAPRSCMARVTSASARLPHSGTPSSGDSVCRNACSSSQRRRLRRKTRRSIAARSHPCAGTRTRTTPRTPTRSSRRRSSASATRAPSAWSPRTSAAVAAIMTAVVTNPRSVSARS